MDNKWEFFKDGDNKWHWRSASRTGDNASLSTEGFANRADGVRAALLFENSLRNRWKGLSSTLSYSILPRLEV
jgi:hypothetical protein